MRQVKSINQTKRRVYQDLVIRITLGLPESILHRLDVYKTNHNFSSRSKTVIDLLNKAEIYDQYQESIVEIKQLKEELKEYRRKENILPTTKEWFENLSEDEQEMHLFNYRKINKTSKLWTRPFLKYIKEQRDQKIVQGRLF